MILYTIIAITLVSALISKYNDYIEYPKFYIIDKYNNEIYKHIRIVLSNNKYISDSIKNNIMINTNKIVYMSSLFYINDDIKIINEINYFNEINDFNKINILYYDTYSYISNKTCNITKQDENFKLYIDVNTYINNFTTQFFNLFNYNLKKNLYSKKSIHSKKFIDNIFHIVINNKKIKNIFNDTNDSNDSNHVNHTHYLRGNDTKNYLKKNDTKRTNYIHYSTWKERNIINYTNNILFYKNITNQLFKIKKKINNLKSINV